MHHKQKSCTSPMLHKFTLLNLINEKYFHIFAITSQNKSTSIVLSSMTEPFVSNEQYVTNKNQNLPP